MIMCTCICVCEGVRECACFPPKGPDCKTAPVYRPGMSPRVKLSKEQRGGHKANFHSCYDNFLIVIYIFSSSKWNPLIPQVPLGASTGIA